jgi:hypothetical protein
MTSPKIATFNGFTFSYEDKCVEEIGMNDYGEVYSDIIVLESNNPKFKKGDKIEQITVSITLHFEHEDGREY